MADMDTAKTSGRTIPFSRPCYGPEEAAAAAAVVESRWVVGGPRLAEFERRIAAHCEVRNGVGTSSWTTGAFLVLKALGIGPGDEVIVPSLTFIASINVISHVGATPVFADVDPKTFNIDPGDIESRITARTKAILPVDQIGLPCDMERVLEIAERNDLLVIQDAACSLGSSYRGRPVGALAPVTVFSLHARKVISTAEGGMIVTNDDDLAGRLRRLRHQGMSLNDFDRHGLPPTVFETYPEIGYNCRITDIQAAIGIAQLDRLPAMLQRRRDIASRYIAALQRHKHIRPPYVPEYAAPNWQSFQVTVDPQSPLDRNAVMNRLHTLGVATRRGVMASHREKPYAGTRWSLPHTEAVADTALQLPIYSDMPDDDVDAVIGFLFDIFDQPATTR